MCELLDKEKLMIDSITACAHNFKIGSFGNKAFKPDDVNDWIQYLQPMRDLIDKLDPEYKKVNEYFGGSHYKLPEESL